jgi:TonB-dependent Receptor Plug Domain/TonB dependent receptor
LALPDGGDAILAPLAIIAVEISRRRAARRRRGSRYALLLTTSYSLLHAAAPTVHWFDRHELSLRMRGGDLKGSRLSASVSFLLSSLCASAWVWTAPAQPFHAGETPALATPEIPPQPSDGAKLPAIQVTAKHAKPRAARAKPAWTAAPSAPTSPVPASPYDTGAPNVAGGAPLQANAASALTVSGAEVNARPFTRPGEALEIVPGLIITQHSGEGKANQYFLRGYNLDHGTDLAITLDDMPMNMRTHAHGQGYADLNFLIPELIGSMDIRKGPYYADVGDFGSAGAVSIGLVDTVPQKVAQFTTGSFGYERFLGYGSTPVAGGNLLYAGEAATYNGPWTNPDDMHKLNGLLRYSQGTNSNGLTVTGMAYDNKWNSTDQVPLRAITSGQLGLYDAFDPSDGGNSSRYSLSARLAETDSGGTWLANAYAVKSGLDLYNNFTYFLTDPVNGDQFHQHDDRVLVGGNASRMISGSVGAMPTETTFGLQTRYDAINLGLTDTVQRQFLSNVRTDDVKEGSVSVYAENVLHWASWLRTVVGWRGDVFAANVNSIYDSANSGNAKMGIGSPKFSMVLGPFYKTEFYLSAGMGYHSNDVRGVTITEDPTDPSTKLQSSPFLVRTKGAEVGVRTKIAPGLNSSVAVFVLDQASEILFSGDAGDTEPSRPSQRIGIEWTNDYRPVPWLALDADLALTHARFIGGFDAAQEAIYESLAGFPQAQIGNAPGNYIPGAPNMIASVSVELGEKIGWFGALTLRYLGPRLLTEDDAFVSPATTLLNGRLGYRWASGWRIQLDAFNLTDSRTDQISYAYGSLIKTDSLFTMCFPASGAATAPAAVCQNGVMDRVLHPVEPLAVRLTIAAAF